MDKNNQPGICFESIILVSERFMRVPNYPSDAVSLKIDFNSKLSSQANGYNVNELETSLKCVNKEDDIVLELVFTYVGIFSVLKDNENMDINEFMTLNSSALMLPYIREHISNITTKSGVETINIPPMNINAMLKGKQRLT